MREFLKVVLGTLLGVCWARHAACQAARLGASGLLLLNLSMPRRSQLLLGGDWRAQASCRPASTGLLAGTLARGSVPNDGSEATGPLVQGRSRLREWARSTLGSTVAPARSSGHCPRVTLPVCWPRHGAGSFAALRTGCGRAARSSARADAGCAERAWGICTAVARLVLGSAVVQSGRSRPSQIPRIRPDRPQCSE